MSLLHRWASTLWLFTATALLLFGCNRAPDFGQSLSPLSPAQATFTKVQTTILVPKCFQCHSTSGERIAGSNDFSTYTSTVTSPGAVTPFQPHQSEIFEKCWNAQMPPRGPYLSASELQLIYSWISYGAPNN